MHKILRTLICLASLACGLAQAKHFDSAKALDRIEAIYASLLKKVSAR